MHVCFAVFAIQVQFVQFACCTFVSLQEKDVFKKKLHEAETEFAKGSVAGLVNSVTTLYHIILYPDIIL